VRTNKPTAVGRLVIGIGVHRREELARADVKDAFCKCASSIGMATGRRVGRWAIVDVV
jgi:hypothetical protein